METPPELEVESPPKAEPLSLASIRDQLAQKKSNAATILRSVIHSDGYAALTASFKGQDALEFIEMLDTAIDTTYYAETDLFQEFRRLCGRTGLLPSSHMLLEQLAKSGDQPTASGGFGDVWKGIYNGKRVAIKALRVYTTNDLDKIRKKFCKEVVLWKKLSHKNVVRFLGVSTSLFPLAMVSDWMTQGNIRQYVRSNPDTDRLKLLIDIAEGLNYLHSSNVVHGDLKGDNILVNDDGWACLCDFGFTSIATSLNATTSASCSRGSIRWMAPELFDMEHAGPEITRPSESSDIYALGMVMLEVFTAQLPFHTNRHDSQVIFQVISGIRPKRPLGTLPLGLSDPIWDLVETCWHTDRAKRPSSTFVLSRLLQADPAVSLQPLITGFNAESKDSIRTLRYALSSRDDVLIQLHGEEAHTFIDILDQAMDSVHIDEELSRRCLRALRHLCGRTGFLPTSYTIPEGGVTKTGDLAFASGGFADVWEGMYNNQRVRIKTLRINLVQDLGRVKTRFCSEAAVWRRLTHENVVPFLGVSTTLDPLCTISPWLERNIVQHLVSNPDANRVHLLLDVLKGLKYLHSLDVVHGNLKGADILINEKGTACLTDYGLASIANETLTESTSEAGTYLSTRWMAPELLDPDNSSSQTITASKSSDMYSFAMVSIEVFTGQIPFHGYKKEGVIIRVIGGKRPDKPEQAEDLGLTDPVWELVEMCWRQEREKRPTVSYALRHLRKAANLDVDESPIMGFGLRPRADSDASVSSFSSKSRTFSKEQELDENTKSYARTGNNFGPTAIKPTRSNGAVFRSLVQSFFTNPTPEPDPEVGEFEATSQLVVEERANTVGARNDFSPQPQTGPRAIKARRTGNKNYRRLLTPSLRGGIGMSDGPDPDEVFDADWATLSGGTPTLSGITEKPMGRGRWPGEVLREVQSDPGESDMMEPPQPEPDPYLDRPVNEDVSFGGYAQW